MLNPVLFTSSSSMKKVIFRILIIFIIAILPIGGFFIAGALQKQVYGETFYAELDKKYQRFNDTKDDEKRLIFIGGSSLSFGLRSDEIEKATGYSVINFGLYAQLGTKIMAELALNNIKENDLVIFAPEISNETYSTNINYEMALKCFENNQSLSGKLSINDQIKLFYSYFGYVIDKATADVYLEEPYTLSSFNEYGDISSSVVCQNILPSHYDLGNMIEPSNELLTKDFISYVNSYNKKVNKKGASMYFTFSPTNALSLNNEKLEEFEINLNEKLDCEVLGSVMDFTYHEDYFYDTNYHLNHAGSLKHSGVLAGKLKEKLNIINSYSIPQEARPAPLYRIGDEVYSSDYLLLNKATVGTEEGFVVTGVKDEYKDKLTSIYVPETFNGLEIMSISSQSFTDLPNLETLIISNKVTNLDSFVFSNCPKLKKIYLCHTKYPPTVGNDFLNGVSDDCLIYVTSLRMYSAGYNWEMYGSRLRQFSMSEIEELMK